MLKPFDPHVLAQVGKNPVTISETQKPSSTPSLTVLNAAPARAVRVLLNFYPPLDVSNPKTFIAGLVTLFGEYPAEVIEAALDPVKGIPAQCETLRSIASVKLVLDKLCEPYDDRIARLRAARSHVLGLPPPMIETTPESLAKVAEMHAEARRILGDPPAKGNQTRLAEGDGRHAQRIADDLAARAARNATRSQPEEETHEVARGESPNLSTRPLASAAAGAINERKIA